MSKIPFPLSNQELYFDWLHDLTLKGYEQNIYFKSEHDKFIEDLFRDGKSTEEALTAYLRIHSNKSNKIK